MVAAEAKNVSIGLDVGTSVIKGVAVNGEGEILASHSLEHLTTNPQPGYAEQEPDGWWQSATEILQVLTSHIDPKSVRSVGLSGQMHGLVIYDGSGHPVRPAIPWLDQRSTGEVTTLRRTVGDAEIYEITGNPMYSGFLLPTLMWVMTHEPDARNRAHQVSSPKDFLAAMLTGHLSTEPTDALATGAFDYHTNNWSEKMIATAGVSTQLFPPIISTDTPYGTITEEAARETGLPAGIPVFGGSDQSMAAVGNGLIQEGQALVSISTGGQFLVVAPKGILDGRRRLHTLNHAKREVGLYMAATLSAGLSLRWFKNEVCKLLHISYDDFLKGVEDVAPGSNGLMFLPFLSGERTPYFNPNLKGGFIGLTREHTQLHMARAIMEGVAFSMRECMNVFTDLHIPIEELVISGGGGKSKAWRQIVTDVLEIPTITLNITDHSPFGAAIWARFADGNLGDMAEYLRRTIKKVDTVKPVKKRSTTYRRIFEAYKALADEMNTKTTSA